MHGAIQGRAGPRLHYTESGVHLIVRTEAAAAPGISRARRACMHVWGLGITYVQAASTVVCRQWRAEDGD